MSRRFFFCSIFVSQPLVTADFHFHFRSLFCRSFFSAACLFRSPFLKNLFFESTTFFFAVFLLFHFGSLFDAGFCYSIFFPQPLLWSHFPADFHFQFRSLFSAVFSAACLFCSPFLKDFFLQLSNFFSSSIFSLSLRRPVCRRFCYSIFFPQPLLWSHFPADIFAHSLQLFAQQFFSW